eukprot:jgi/Bigna1/147362/aug1.143_g22070
MITRKQVDINSVLNVRSTKSVLYFLNEEDSLAFMSTCKKLYENQKLWQLMVFRPLNSAEMQQVSHPTDTNFRKLFQRRRNEILYKTEQWLSRHSNLRQSFFPILCNWLVELHFELFTKENRRLLCKDPLGPIHLAVKYLYRYMSITQNVSRSRLQLVGVSCYQVAVSCLLSDNEMRKLELDSKRFAYYTDNAYSPEEVTSMTANILKTLDFKVCVFTPKKATEEILSKLGKSCSRLTALFAHYFIDLTMHSTMFACHLPSTVAAAAILVASKETGNPIRPGSKQYQTLVNYSLQPQDIPKCVKVVKKIYEEAKKQETGGTFDIDSLPRHSMVIKHYQVEFIESVKGSLIPSLSKKLF